MNEEDLNIEYIKDKTGLVDNDELIPIILEMIQESYKTGLCQSEFDNTMEVIEENKQLQQENKELKEQLNNPLRGIFAQVNDDELLISNAMNYKEAQDYKQALLDIKEYIEQKYNKDVQLRYIEEDLLNIVNKALGSDKQ